MSKATGLDFGTTNSALAIAGADRKVSLAHFNGQATFRSPFGKVLPMPLWFYEHLERWHNLSFLKTRKNMETLNKLHFQALEPQKIAALIELVENDLGYRLYRAIEQTKCDLSTAPRSDFVVKEISTAIVETLTRCQFEK